LASRFQRRRFFKEIDQSETRIASGGLWMDREAMSNLYRGPSIDVSYHVSVHLAMWFQSRRFFSNQPIRNKNCLWRPCLFSYQDEMSNLYRGLPIYASYQVLVHLGLHAFFYKLSLN
jgi:hypothetical protein